MVVVHLLRVITLMPRTLLHAMLPDLVPALQETVVTVAAAAGAADTVTKATPTQSLAEAGQDLALVSAEHQSCTRI